MLQAKNRLTKKSDFELVFKRGRIFQGRFFGLASIASGDGESKVGFIVSNKISGLATQRNRIKRVARDTVRVRINSLPKGILMVVLAKKAAVQAESYLLKEDLTLLLEKIQ